MRNASGLKQPRCVGEMNQPSARDRCRNAWTPGIGGVDKNNVGARAGQDLAAVV